MVTKANGMLWPIATLPLEMADDVVHARQCARVVAQHLGFGGQDQTRIATALSEIARNAVDYAGDGKVDFLLAGQPDRYLIVRVRDSGRGIANLSLILEGRYQSATGMGLGMTGARRLMDCFDVETSPAGTRVTLGKELPASITPTAALVPALANAIRALRSADPDTAIRDQNRDLIESLASLAERETEAHRLNLELEETNRGVVALHAELERQADELRRAGETLEHQVATRTRELADANARLLAEAKMRERVEGDLRQAQKMEAVGQLTGGLAHDFNNLLAGIAGSLELMERRISQGRFGDLGRYMSVAQGAAKRAAALTHRLLAFSRQQTLDPKPTDVNRLIAGLEELVRRTIGPAIKLEVVGSAGLWPALIDPGQLENALLNLCINARDAMPDGGRITVETANKWLDDHAARQHNMAPGQYLSVCITDTGTGMSPEVIAKVFEPFFTTKPTGQGTGLGLSMVYGFAQQSGGQTRIYSEPGKGTTVCLYLPRHYGEANLDNMSPKLAPIGRAEQGETVLIVDDEPSVRMLVTEVLEDLGYTAIEAADSVAGLKVLQSDVRIDLLITDVGLPGGMNGRQIADAGRSWRSGLKVLFITGYAENALVGNGHLEAGMHVMTKPFAVDELASRVKRLINDA